MNDQTPTTNPYSHSDETEARYPNLVGYLQNDDSELNPMIANHTTTELDEIEAALESIEAAMIRIYRNAEIDYRHMLHNAINTIWDNARDLAYDEDQLES